MKIKFKQDLLDLIDRESAWRKREIINIQGFALANQKVKKVKPVVKSVILLSYSHWEGFVKTVSSFYLQFLKTQSLPVSQLSLHLLSSLYFWYDNKNQLNAEESIKNYKSLLNGEQHPIVYYIDEMCSTESNLNFKVLSKILFSIGLDSTHFLAYKPFIDERLLNLRNKFAHGDNYYDEDVDMEIAIDISKKVLELMDCFKNELENAVVAESYKREQL